MEFSFLKNSKPTYSKTFLNNIHCFIIREKGFNYLSSSKGAKQKNKKEEKENKPKKGRKKPKVLSHNFPSFLF